MYVCSSWSLSQFISSRGQLLSSAQRAIKLKLITRASTFFSSLFTSFVLLSLHAYFALWTGYTQNQQRCIHNNVTPTKPFTTSNLVGNVFIRKHFSSRVSSNHCLIELLIANDFYIQPASLLQYKYIFINDSIISMIADAIWYHCRCTMSLKCSSIRHYTSRQNCNLFAYQWSICFKYDT